MNRTADKNFFRRGIASVEFALTLGVFWIPLLLGIADGTYFLIVNEKTDRIAVTVADIVTQYQTSTPAQSETYLTQATISDIMLASGQLMKPITFNPADLGSLSDGEYPTAKGYVIVTSVYQDATQGAIVKWQYSCAPATSSLNTAGICPTGTGITMPPSKVGTSVGSAATLPHNLTLNTGENVIVAEVYFDFTPMFLDSFLAQTLYRAVVYKPRIGSLVTAPS